MPTIDVKTMLLDTIRNVRRFNGVSPAPLTYQDSQRIVMQLPRQYGTSTGMVEAVSELVYTSENAADTIMIVCMNASHRDAIKHELNKFNFMKLCTVVTAAQLDKHIRGRRLDLIIVDARLTEAVMKDFDLVMAPAMLNNNFLVIYL